jgi:RES domain-containing protein
LTPQQLDRVVTAYRIGDPAGKYAIFDATGSTIWPGRWNTSASPMLYTSQHYSTAMLEKLVHGGGRLPPDQHFIEIKIPNGVLYEVVTPSILPGWDDPSPAVSKVHGEAWQKSKRSLLLIVPSYVARVDRNFLLNPEHDDYAKVQHGLHEPVWWDARFFSPATP